MDTTARRRRVQKLQEAEPESEFYTHDVNLYTKTPLHTIPLAEFEELALERLQLLRIIEQASLKGAKLFSEEWKQCIKEDLLKAGLKKYVRLLSGFCSQTELDVQARRADHLSHYILRLAYCRSEDLRRWFLAREQEWFKLRFLAQTPQGVTKFLEANGLRYYPISDEQKGTLQAELVASTAGVNEVSFESTDFYRLPFEEVVPLVRNRRVLLQLGCAYIPTSDLVVCVQGKFRAGLSEALTVYNQRLPTLDDDRLNALLANLHDTYTGKEYVAPADKDRVDPACLDAYAKQHFPLCMRSIHEALRATHHLRHFARLQYGLFLKAIGLVYDDAMTFWRDEFTKTMDGAKFDKQYAYNVKHQYGQVGSRTNYSPFSCVKIITTGVGPGDCHGCPFSHWDPTLLKQKLVECGLSGEGVSSITDLAKNSHYQIACTKYFECVHNQPPVTTISHPNQYFEESTNVFKEKTTKT